KQVSSSQAHIQVMTSPFFVGRVERAKLRLEQLLSALNVRDWHNIFQITWDEFIDMHKLFETANPAFSYQSEGSKKVLQIVQEYWRENKDGPLVTMDAGPNVHFLWRPEQIKSARWLGDELK